MGSSADDQFLVLKARANRGYGFPYTTTVEPAQVSNSAFQLDSLEASIEALGSTDEALAALVRTTLFGGDFVFSGEDVEFRFSQAQVRQAQTQHGGVLVQLRYPALEQLAVSVLSDELIDWAIKRGLDKADSAFVAAFAIANCGSSDVGDHQHRRLPLCVRPVFR